MPTKTSYGATLTLDSLVRSVSVNKSNAYSIFLGAGASISSGVLSAETCIWEWKREIFLSNNPGLETEFNNLDVPVTRDRIQQWLDLQGRYPSSGSKLEYSFYIETCYPLTDDRREFFSTKMRGINPYTGYKQLALLADEGVFDTVWTTNFDNLTVQACRGSSIPVVEVGLDSSHRLTRAKAQGELLHISLHGDYRYDALKNTDSELRQQHEDMRRAFIERAKNQHLIVIGYSGRDQSIMEMLTEAYTSPGAGRLYWCGYNSSSPSPAVEHLINLGRRQDREMYYVSALGFDDLMDRLAVKCLWGDRLTKAYDLRKQFTKRTASFAVRSTRTIGLIKGNLVEVDCPKQVQSMELMEGVSAQEVWKSIRKEGNSQNDFVAAPLYKNLLITGNLDSVRQRFSGYVVADSLKPFNIEKQMHSGVVKHVLLKSIVKQLGKQFGLATNGESVLWEKAYRERRVKSTLCRVHDGLVVYLRTLRGRQYLALKPTVVGTDSQGGRLPPDVEKEMKRSILTYQYNSKFDEAFMKWRSLLLPKNHNAYTVPGVIPTTFVITGVPVYMRVSSDDPSYGAIAMPDKIEPFIQDTAVQLPEPDLLFSNVDGRRRVRDASPIRGIVRNRPFDFLLTTNGFNPQTKLGIICPTKDSRRLYDFVSKLNQRVGVDSKAEYLLDYPGYGKAFGLPLDVPMPGGPSWANCLEIDGLKSKRSGLMAIYTEIVSGIDSIRAAAVTHVIVIFVPSRWKYWESYSDDSEQLDLHDMVKAYCVQRGIATQFLREETFRKTNQCEIRWWLSLSLYAKCMRTPWTISNSSPDTAYVGIGYSYDDRTAGSKREIVLGCSHIYDSNGLGLRYKVGRIERPIFHNKRPHMNRDDARRMGETIREQFFTSRQKLPKRVVFHKNSPFLDEERAGLLEGMAGVEAVDMVEVNVENAVRFIASKPSGNKFGADGFPIRRGTCVVLSDNEALLWSHGTTNATGGRRQYYQGKSRIPAPLLVRRYCGEASLSVIGSELLGLCKIDWNTFDMYTTLPATVHTSSRIARISRYVEDYGTLPFDYRLFM